MPGGRKIKELNAVLERVEDKCQEKREKLRACLESFGWRALDEG
jgi:hypothetical protein